MRRQTPPRNSANGAPPRLCLESKAGGRNGRGVACGGVPALPFSLVPKLRASEHTLPGGNSVARPGWGSTRPMPARAPSTPAAKHSFPGKPPLRSPQLRNEATRRTLSRPGSAFAKPPRSERLPAHCAMRGREHQRCEDKPAQGNALGPGKIRTSPERAASVVTPLQGLAGFHAGDPGRCPGLACRRAFGPLGASPTQKPSGKASKSAGSSRRSAPASQCRMKLRSHSRPTLPRARRRRAKSGLRA